MSSDYEGIPRLRERIFLPFSLCIVRKHLCIPFPFYIIYNPGTSGKWRGLTNRLTIGCTRRDTRFFYLRCQHWNTYGALTQESERLVSTTDFSCVRYFVKCQYGFLPVRMQRPVFYHHMQRLGSCFTERIKFSYHLRPHLPDSGLYQNYRKGNRSG